MPLFPPNYVVGSTSTAPSGTGFTRSQTEPATATRAIGDLWMELNSSDFPKYGWLWHWDGSKWLSPDFELNYSINNLPGRFDYFIHCNPSFNYYFKAMNSNSSVNYPQTSAYYWKFDLLSISPGGADPVVNLFNETTIGQSRNQWQRRNTPIGIFVDVGARATGYFNLIVQPNDGSSNIYAAIQLIYNLARLPSG
jgi:hypothetical protein